MIHTCPNCGNWCSCEEADADGSCLHDCDSWKAEGGGSLYADNAEPDDYFER